MMHNRRMQLELEALVDGTLPEARRAQLLRHLDECAPCAAEMRRLTELDGVFQGACPRPILQSADEARDLFLRALATAGIEAHPAGRRWGQLAWGVLAALALTVTGGVAVWHRGQPAGMAQIAGQHIPVPAPMVRQPDRPVPVATVPAGPAKVAVQRPARRVRWGGRSRLARQVSHRSGGRRVASVRRPAAGVRLAHQVEPRRSPLVARAEPELRIELAAGRPQPLLQVSTSSQDEGTPGYARVAGWLARANGEVVWSQAIVESGSDGAQVALLPVALNSESN
jgi:hypothetical protein